MGRRELMKNKLFYGMKKALCVMLTGMLLAGSLAGCSDQTGSASEQTQSPSGQTKEDSVSEQSDAKQESTGTKEEASKQNRFPDRANADTKTGEVKELKEGDVAPDFTASLVDGGTFVLSDHDDEVVLLNFFATWCGPCMREMPAFEMLKADEYENLAILCVDCMEEKKVVNSFVKEEAYTFPIAYDVEGAIETYYPTNGIPYTLVICQGVISKIYIGARDTQTQYQEYKSAID